MQLHMQADGMKIKSLAVLILAISILTSSILIYSDKNCKADLLPKLYVDLTYDMNTPGWNVTHFNSIQLAINSENCNHGDRIIVYNGEYKERLLINKSISLFGEDAEKTIINGQGIEDVITINNSQVDLSTFTIKNSGSSETNSGIKVSTDNCRIIDNIISGCRNGIFISNYDEITIAYNSIKNNVYGIFLSSSSKNKIENNKIYSNSNDGIFLNETCNNNQISGNEIYSNSGGNGVYLHNQCDDNDILDNTIYSNGVIGIRIENSSNNNIDENTIRVHNNFYGIMVVGNKNSITNCIIIENKHGIFLLADNYTTIYQNTIKDNNLDGIRLQNSTGNKIYTNRITGNKRYGVFINYFSIDNEIYNNYLQDNNINAWDISTSENFWNKEIKNVKNIIGGKNINGNYWDDYNGVDEKSGPQQDQSGSDGIGDIPYTILPGNKKDYKPLVPRNPIADANGIYTAYMGETITFDGSKSSDPDGNGLNYSWDFGDKTNGFGKKINHKYTSVGEYVVILTVTNSYGKKDTNTTKAIILTDNQPPKITIETYGQSTIYPNSFLFKVKVTDETEVSKVYIEYWYENSEKMISDMDNIAKDYYQKVITPPVSTNKVYCVIYAEDTSGNKNDTKKPFAFAGGPYNGVPAYKVTFNATDSFDLDGEITHYSWDFGDGITGTGERITHTYSSNGNYTITLTITDDDGNINTDTTYAIIFPLTLQNTSNSTLDLIENLFGISLAKTFYCYDTDGDLIPDIFIDPNGILKAVHSGSINISGNYVFLLSYDDPNLPNFIWNSTTDEIINISIKQSRYGTLRKEPNNIISYYISVEKSTGWIYFKISQPDISEFGEYKELLSVTKNRTEIDADKKIKRGNDYYILDDPEQLYAVTFSYELPTAKFLSVIPEAGGLINKDNPSITISYSQPVIISSAFFYNEEFTVDLDIIKDLKTTDYKTFTYTPPSDLVKSLYHFDIIVKDDKGNIIAKDITYQYTPYVQVKSEFSLINFLIYIGFLGGVFVVLLLIFRYKNINFESFIYFKNKKIIPFFKPIVFGPLKIDVNDENVKKAEFYLNGELKDTITQPPFIWNLNEKSFMKQKIETKIIDKQGNSSTSGEMTFFVFNSPRFFK